MKRVLNRIFVGFFIALGVLLATSTCGEIKAKTVTWNQKKEYTITQGEFIYHAYRSTDKKQAWIYQIEVPIKCLSGCMTIPVKIAGSPVTTIGAPEDLPDWGMTVFGDGIEPESNSIDDDEDGGCVSSIGFIKRVVIPQTVTKLNHGCFAGLRDLSEVNIPHAMTLSDHVFADCDNLDKVTFAEGTYKISEVAFEFSARKYMNIFSEGGTFYAKDGTLLSKDKKRVVAISYDKVSIQIPKGVTEIPENVFDQCKAKTVSIPKSVKKIGDNAFSTEQNVKFTIDKKNKNFGLSGGCIYQKKTKRLVVGVVKSGTLTVPDKVKKLDGHGSLVGKNVKKLIIPKSVKKLEAGWFESGNYGVVDTHVYFHSRKAPAGGIGTVPVNTVVYVPKKGIKSYMKWFLKDPDNAGYAKLKKYK